MSSTSTLATSPAITSGIHAPGQGGGNSSPRPAEGELFRTLHASLLRRASAMHLGGQSHLVGLTLWLAIETYVRTPGREQLTRDEGDRLYDLLEPHFSKPVEVGEAPLWRNARDAELLRVEKARRAAFYRKTGRDWFGRPLSRH